jgi:hypothetical protein
MLKWCVSNCPLDHLFGLLSSAHFLNNSCTQLCKVCQMVIHVQLINWFICQPLCLSTILLAPVHVCHGEKGPYTLFHAFAQPNSFCLIDLPDIAMNVLSVAPIQATTEVYGRHKWGPPKACLQLCTLVSCTSAWISQSGFPSHTSCTAARSMLIMVTFNLHAAISRTGCALMMCKCPRALPKWWTSELCADDVPQVCSSVQVWYIFI